MKRVDSKEEVESFLTAIRNLINNPNFDISDFIVMKNRKNYENNNKYTNKSTLLELGYHTKEVIEIVKKLKLENYMETVDDDRANSVNPLYCFIKNIKDKNVYIKLKFKERDNKRIICISFHFCEYEVKIEDLPYVEK